MKKRQKPIKAVRVSKNKEVARLTKLAEKMWKEHAHRRDGEGCQVAIHFPEIPVPHNDIYQIDHCVKRGLKALFFDPRNSTKVCAKCNWAKFRDLWGVKRAIDEIVRKREGEEAWADLKRIEQQKPLVEFKQVWWLEGQIERLQTALAAAKEARGMSEAVDSLPAPEKSGSEEAA